MNAAEENGISFFPIIPGKEGNSWKRFLEEGFERFLSGNFRGDYEQGIIKEFREKLPSVPPWERSNS